jgi:thioredoxin-dependent peroxiredoxin
MLKIGEEAPHFSLSDQSGQIVSLLDFRGKKNVVIFFYPKDNTPGCTSQSCSFRDNYEGFNSFNTQVIGISDDSVKSHQKFSTENRLPYPVLSDEGGEIRKRFGLKSFLGIFPPRVSFVIDQNGIIQHIFSSQVQIARHIDETLQAVQRLAALK